MNLPAELEYFSQIQFRRQELKFIKKIHFYCEVCQSNKNSFYLMFDNSPNNIIFDRDSFEQEVAHVVLVLLTNDLNCIQKQSPHLSRHNLAPTQKNRHLKVKFQILLQLIYPISSWISDLTRRIRVQFQARTICSNRKSIRFTFNRAT